MMVVEVFVDPNVVFRWPGDVLVNSIPNGLEMLMGVLKFLVWSSEPWCLDFKCSKYFCNALFFNIVRVDSNPSQFSFHKVFSSRLNFKSGSSCYCRY